MPKNSSNSLKTSWINSPQADSIHKFVECASQLNPLLVVLFGSLSIGEYTQYSDADVLVIFEQPADWLEVYTCSDGIVQPVVKTWKEVNGQVERNEPFYMQIINEGLVLWDAENYWLEITKKAQVNIPVL